MDRRDFVKTLFATPLLAPFLVGSSFSSNNELLLISDNPGGNLPPLLKELKIPIALNGQSFVFCDAHPHKKALSRALEASGWTKTYPGQKADLSLSFRSLQHPSPPSFTLIRAGKILDIRTKKLHSLWTEMNQKHPPSSCLTVATLQAPRLGNLPGKLVRIYHNGQVVEEASLKKDRVQNFVAGQGKLTVKIENGKAFIPSSSCPHKICCGAPPVSFSGERIVCAPNHFLLEIQGSGPIDTIIG